MSNKVNARALLAMAEEARGASYSPYSGISVGAALLTATGKVYRGANIENASYSPTICAERVAFFKAISEGECDFIAIAIAGGESGKPSKADFPPCGVCRQVMSEFCNGNFRVIWGNGEKITDKSLSEMLPFGFDKTNL
jgi:cytidine deaminase